MTVLVTYASKHGSTEEIAQRIAGSLRSSGREVVVQPVPPEGSVAAYEAVIVGSAVYTGHWMKPAAEFVRRHRDVLSARPVWLFSSGPVGPQELPEAVEAAELRTLVSARGHRTFAGALRGDRLSSFERLMVRAVRAPQGDFRDWDDVDAWAAGIAAQLSGMEPSTWTRETETGVARI